MMGGEKTKLLLAVAEMFLFRMKDQRYWKGSGGEGECAREAGLFLRLVALRDELVRMRHACGQLQRVGQRAES